VIGTSPFTEFTNVLTVQGNGFSSNFIQLVGSQDYLGSVDSRGKHSKFGLLSTHVQGCGGCHWSWATCERVGGSRGRDHKGLGGREGQSQEDKESSEGVHGDNFERYCVSECNTALVAVRSA